MVLRGTLQINNELIQRRRRRKVVKRSIVFSTLLISLLVILCLKLSYFNVSNIVILNNEIINTEEILELSKINKGTNIFYMDLKNIQTNVLSNPYILKANVKRKLPNTISIEVQEREAVFYAKNESGNLIIDRLGVVLEKKDDTSGMNLTNLTGIDFGGAKVGKVIPCDDNRKINFITEITDLIEANTSGIKITSVDLSDFLDIKIYSNNICIKVGDNSNLENKLNEALNIIVNNKLVNSIGYIDVSFQGNPVVHVEKQEETE